MQFCQRLAKYFLFLAVAESLCVCVQSPLVLRNVDIFLTIFFQSPTGMSDTRYLGFILWEKDKKSLIYLCLVLFLFFIICFGELCLFILFCFLHGAWKPNLSIMHKAMLVLLSLSPGTFSSDHRSLPLCDLLCMNRIIAEECTCQDLSSGTPSLSMFNKVWSFCLCLHLPST